MSRATAHPRLPTPPSTHLSQAISKVVGDMWAQLPGDERQPYHELAQRDRERYEQELREYQARFPQVRACVLCWARVGRTRPASTVWQAWRV